MEIHRSYMTWKILNTGLTVYYRYSQTSLGARNVNTGGNRPIIKVLRCRLGFAKVMTCGGRYTEKHMRCRTSTQTMIFTADMQKGELDEGKVLS